jgi:predicted house-cleaning noncanonical NTP pyrophosphatase (MazG superfamily)
MQHNKLVRDKIPDLIKTKGQKAVIHIASDEEYWQRLKEKLQEEVKEFCESENQEEIADILEVLNAICDFKNINKDHLELLRQQKAEIRGSFKDKIILDETID